MLTLAHIGGRAFGGGFFFLGPLLFLLLVGLLIYLFTRRSGRQPFMAHPSPGLRVLEERYAAGEIERDEYLAKREDLANWPRKRKKDDK